MFLFWNNYPRPSILCCIRILSNSEATYLKIKCLNKTLGSPDVTNKRYWSERMWVGFLCPGRRSNSSTVPQTVLFVLRTFFPFLFAWNKLLSSFVCRHQFRPAILMAIQAANNIAIIHIFPRIAGPVLVQQLLRQPLRCLVRCRLEINGSKFSRAISLHSSAAHWARGDENEIQKHLFFE